MSRATSSVSVTIAVADGYGGSASHTCAFEGNDDLNKDAAICLGIALESVAPLNKERVLRLALGLDEPATGAESDQPDLADTSSA